MKSSILISLANNIKARRKKLCLSQEQLAEKAGVHRTYIGMSERAEKNITIRNIYKIAKALNTTISALCKGIDDAN